MSLPDDGTGPTAADSAFWGGGGAYEGQIGPWAALLLNGQWFPGADALDSPGVIPCYIEGLELEYQIDSQRVKKKSGHKLVVNGYKPTPFTARFRITNAEQWAAFKAYFGVINPKLKENLRRAYPVQHPIVTAYGINSVFINQVTSPTEADGRMVRDVKLRMWEVFGLDNAGSNGSKVVAQTDYDGNVIAEGRNQGSFGTVSRPERKP